MAFGYSVPMGNQGAMAAFGPQSTGSYYWEPWSFNGAMNGAMNQMMQMNLANQRASLQNTGYQAQVQQAALPAQYNAQAAVQTAQTNAEAEKYKALLAQQAQQSRTDAMLKALSGLTGSFGDLFKGGFPGQQAGPYQSGVGQQQAGTFNDPYRQYAQSARTGGRASMRGAA